jgi:hypothetical protein
MWYRISSCYPQRGLKAIRFVSALMNQTSLTALITKESLRLAILNYSGRPCDGIAITKNRGLSELLN